MDEWLVIRLCRRVPPAGEVGGHGLAPRAFEGWLDLLRVLASVLEDRSDEGGAGGESQLRIGV